MTDPSLQMILTIVPEIILIAVATWIYLGAAFARRPVDATMFAVLGLVVAGMWLGVQNYQMMTDSQLAGVGVPAASGPVALDALSFVIRALTLVSGFLLTLAASQGGGPRLSGEFLGSLLMAVAGVMLASAAVDLVLLFVALELISIPTYVLLFLSKSDQGSAEATAKYFFLSILSSAVLLYGFTLLYGIAGSTMIPEIAAAIAASEGITTMAVAALVLVFAGLSFKLAAVPFHFYAPDVYQGTSSGVAGLLAVLPKIAGVVVLARLVAASIPGIEGYGWHLVLIIAVLTMTLGNFAALWQNDIRRLLAYSSIAHSGYLLIGLTAALSLGESGAARYNGLAAMLFYLIVYVLATIAAFAALAWLGSREREVNKVEELSGLIKTHPLSAAAIGIAMFSLTGIPPLAGFWGKLTLFASALQAGWMNVDDTQRFLLVGLAIAAALNAAVSAGYYLRIVGVMFFGTSQTPPPAAGPRGAIAAAGLCAVGLLGVGLFPGPLMHAAQGAGKAAISTTRDYRGYEPVEEGEPPENTDVAVGELVRVRARSHEIPEVSRLLLP